MNEVAIFLKISVQHSVLGWVSGVGCRVSGVVGAQPLAVGTQVGVGCVYKWRYRRLLRIGVAIVVMLFSWTIALTPSAFAQSAPAEPDPIELAVPPRPANPDASTIPSEKVSQFVRACVQVVKLIERREGELQGAETESESLRVEREIEAEAIAIIEQAGLTRQEYLQLLSLANVDPEFGDRVAAQLQEATN